MEIVHAHCCGLDVHKKSVVACVLVTTADGEVQRRARTFGTMTADLLALDDWLTGLDITQIAMESTGVYWRPVFNLLESDERTITLVNAQHLKAVPGRKTDVKDSEWLADLLRHGLVKASFIPSAPIRALRELTRCGKRLVQQRAHEVNRLHKLLEGMNVKLAAVASNILGKSGRAMLDALLAGETDANVRAGGPQGSIAVGQLRKKREALTLALDGRLLPHHRVLLGQVLAHLDFLDGQIAQLGETITEYLAPFAEAEALVATIPGIGAVAAAALLAEIGADMRRFPSTKHLASWAGVCPGNKQSGGKRLGARTTSGNVWLKGIVTECAWAAARTKGTYLAAQFKRLAGRRGVNRALVAVAHSMLVSIYYVLSRGQAYHELGATYFDQIDVTQKERYHVKRLAALGYTVTLTPQAASSA